MTEFNTLINNLANPHGKAFSLKKLAIVVSSILDTTFLIYSVNSLLAGQNSLLSLQGRELLFFGHHILVENFHHPLTAQDQFLLSTA